MPLSGDVAVPEPLARAAAAAESLLALSHASCRMYSEAEGRAGDESCRKTKASRTRASARSLAAASAAETASNASTMLEALVRARASLTT